MVKQRKSLFKRDFFCVKIKSSKKSKRFTDLVASSKHHKNIASKFEKTISCLKM